MQSKRYQYVLAVAITILLLINFPGFSQINLPLSANVDLVQNVNPYPNLGYTDCWGYTAPNGNHYALLAAIGGVSIIDLSDPANIQEVDFVPWISFSWYDIKTYQNHMYVSTEGINEVLIVDLSTLPNPVSVVGTLDSLSSQPHNLFINESSGLLFVIEDFNTAGPVGIYSLADPANPAFLSALVPGLGTDAHDVYSSDTLLYVAEGSSPTIGIFSIADPANPVLLSRFPVPSNGYVHNVWASDDHRYLMTTEETPQQTVKMWDILDRDNAQLISEYLGGSELAHNVMIRDDFAYLSHYESGFKVLDISDPQDIVEVGYFDSFPEGEGSQFNGVWGVFPFFANGDILISDQGKGLYVLQFDSLRAGGLSGVVSDAVSAAPLEDVSIEFIEAMRLAETDLNGEFTLRTFEGNHTLILSKLGYFSDTVSVTFPSGPNVMQNFSLVENLADISVDPDSISLQLPADTVATVALVVSNSGPGGRLDYAIADYNGPLAPLVAAPAGYRPPHSLQFPSEISTAATERYSEGYSGPLALVRDTILTDPANDLVFGSGGDVVALYVDRTSDNMTFELEFAEPIHTDSAYAIFGLDLDFDANTGAFPGGFGFLSPGQGIGSEVDILIDVAGNLFPAAGTYVFVGSNSPGGGNLLFSTSFNVNVNRLSFTLPLASLNDDGNFRVAAFTGHAVAGGGVISVDLLPDAGNGTVGINPTGDLPWMSLSSEGGSLTAGQSDTIIATINTAGLASGSTHSGVIAINSNDANQLLTVIPVHLDIETEVAIGDRPTIAGEFNLRQNFPNPFNPKTDIRYQTSEFKFINLTVYDILGRKVKALINEPKQPGEYTVTWDGRDEAGAAVGSGVYFYRLTAGKEQLTRRMLLMR